MSVREYNETSLKLGKEYGIREKNNQYIVTEYKDKNDEAVASARLFYETNPRHSLPAPSSVNSV